MTEPENQSGDISQAVQSLRKRVQRLTVAVIVMILAVLLNTAAIYGDLVNYFSSDRALQGGVGVGAALLGFVCGWLARGRV